MSAENDADSPTPAEQAPAPVDWAADDTPEPEQQPDPGPPDPENAAVEGDDDPPEPPKAAADDDPIGDDDPPGDDADAPPEFWSADKKALWAKVQDPEVKAAIKEHVAEVSRATARKLEENAGKVRQAEESARAALANQEAAVQWWQQNGAMIETLVQGEFANIDWNRLSAENPAEWARARQAYEDRQRWLAGVTAKVQQDAQQVQQRQRQAEQGARVAEHQKLAERYPNEFGTPDKAQRTYDVLSKFLAEKGIPAERISQVYESAVVEVVMDAYKYRRLRARAPNVTASKPPAAPATMTPTRVAPGAARRPANPVSEAERQAIERLRSGMRLTPEEAAVAFR